MTKSDFVELVKKHGEFSTQKEAENAIKAFTASVTEALVKRESVSLVGFGTYTTVDVEEKSGKVPGTDKTYTKAAHIGCKFKYGKTIKDAVASK